MALVLYLAYIATKLMARSRFPRKGANFELIDSMAVGQQSMVTILRIGGRYVLIGVAKDSINFLMELSPDDVTLKDGQALRKIHVPFEKYFGKFFEKKPGTDGSDAAESEEEK